MGDEAFDHDDTRLFEVLFDIRSLLARLVAYVREVTTMAKKWKKTRTTLDRQFWQRYDETTRRLLERIEYHKRKAAEARAARDVASGDAA